MTILEATVLYQLGEVGRAMELLDAAISAVPDDRERRMLQLQKAGWLREAGAAEAATALLTRLERELEEFAPFEVALELAQLYMERGILARQRGDLDTAESCLARSAEIIERMPAEDQELLLSTNLANRASVLIDKGRLSEARDLAMRALGIDRRMGDVRNETHDLNLLGIIHQTMGNVGTAHAYYTQSFETARAAGLSNPAAQAAANRASLLWEPDDDPVTEESGLGIDRACTVSIRGTAALRRGDYKEAAELLRRAWQMHLEVGHAAHGIHDRLNLSLAELARGNHDEAVAVARSAVEDARTNSLTRVQWYAEYRYAECLLGSIDREPGAAAPRTVEALESLSKSMDLIELLRTGIDHPDDRQWLLTGKEPIYELALIAHVYIDPAEAFRISERARARAFLEVVGGSRLARIEQGSDAAGRRRDLIARALRSDADPAERKQMVAELSRLRSEIVAESPALAPLTGDALPDLTDICAAIPEDARLVDFFLLGSSKLAVFLLSRHGMQSCYLADISRRLSDSVAAFRRRIEVGDAMPPLGRELFGTLLAPLMNELQGVGNLYVVPHGVLHHLPWAALWFPTDRTDETVPERLFLRNRFLITLLPSASYLPLLQAPYGAGRASWKPTAVVLGDPTGELPGAASEARLVASLLGVRPFIRSEATREILLAADQPTVIHVCCHGRFDAADPLLSGLELADGVVTVEDFLERGAAAKLMVLSACLTGFSGQRAGDELVGLARAALSNGGRTVVATLWSVSDESSETFFRYFYGALKHGASVSHALFFAQDTMPVEHPELGEPFDWAPYCLIGDPDTRIQDA